MDALISSLVHGTSPAIAVPGPTWAHAATLAEIGNSTILAIGLMVAGAFVLRHAFRPKKETDAQILQQPGRVQPFSPPPPAPASPEHDDLGDLMIEVKQLRNILADETDRHAERLETLIARAEETIRRLEAAASAPARPAAAREMPTADPLSRRIYELADQGLAPLDIARTLNQQTGKVELVLALRPR